MSLEQELLEGGKEDKDLLCDGEEGYEEWIKNGYPASTSRVLQSKPGELAWEVAAPPPCQRSQAAGRKVGHLMADREERGRQMRVTWCRKVERCGGFRVSREFQSASLCCRSFLRRSKGQSLITPIVRCCSRAAVVIGADKGYCTCRTPVKDPGDNGGSFVKIR